MTQWGRRKDNKQAYPKTGPKGVSGSGINTSPTSDVHTKVPMLGESLMFEKPFSGAGIQRDQKMYDEERITNNITEMLKSKNGFPLRLHVKSGGDFDMFSIYMIGEEPVDLNIEPRGDESYIINKIKDRFADTEIKNHDDLYLFGKHFDDLIGHYYQSIMSVFRENKNKEFSSEELSVQTDIDQSDIDGMIEILYRRGWIRNQNNAWKYKPHGISMS